MEVNFATEKHRLEALYAEQALDKPFAQAEDLKLVRENHSEVMKELKLTQEINGYISE